jgi:hypothetical protein
VTQGSELVREFAPLDGWPKCFCSACGSALWSKHPTDEGVVSVTSIVGNRTHSLDGLRVRPERGLGGRAMMELRPRMTNDYGSSQQITHDYDVFVLGEGLRTLWALPIVVSGRPRGVLYAGAWERTPVGGVTTAPAMQVAQSVADELRIRDEVDRRLRAVSPGSESVAPRQREELRPQNVEPRAFQEDAADDDEEVAEWNEERDRLDDGRHVLDRENES